MIASAKLFSTVLTRYNFDCMNPGHVSLLMFLAGETEIIWKVEIYWKELFTDTSNLGDLFLCVMELSFPALQMQITDLEGWS